MECCKVPTNGRETVKFKVYMKDGNAKKLVLSKNTVKGFNPGEDK